MSGRGYLKLIRDLRTAGWRVELIYLALPSVEMSRLRVAERVAHGGHAIPEADIIRRFPRSLHHLLTSYGEAVDQVHAFLNAGPEPVLVFRQAGGVRTIFDQDTLDQLIQEVRP